MPDGDTISSMKAASRPLFLPAGPAVSRGFWAWCPGMPPDGLRYPTRFVRDGVSEGHTSGVTVTLSSLAAPNLWPEVLYDAAGRCVGLAPAKED